MSPNWDENAEEEADIAEEYGSENVERDVPAVRGWRGWAPSLRMPRFWGAQAVESADEKAAKSDD